MTGAFRPVADTLRPVADTLRSVADTFRPRKGPSRRRSAVAAFGAVLAAAVLASGCGIRTTSVPVDAGAAPSRVPCRLPSADVTTRSPDSVAAPVYLVCASQLVSVDRPVPADDASGSGRLGAARALLYQVQQAPPENERRAGFSTAVPTGLRVEPSRADDPAGTLRLSSQPEDLSAEALAQLVCTYAENEALVTEGSVVLGGPGKYPPRGYLCTSQTKSRPQDVTTPDALELD
ncbi:hypothetical protein [Streptomyces sp. NPDC007346]|uniref:hypothetical protein n=1 Tax=Streptomyces sp. NPDC007346 TaxID=3154682 RepID=UPI00345533F6